MDYTSYITSQHQDKPLFMATVRTLCDLVQQVSTVLDSMPQAFNVDTAVGAQLDVVGEWIGTSRRLSAPIDNVFFSWDTTGKGWDEGYWKDAFVPVDGVAYLDDTSYRAALRLRIAVNHWSGQNQAYLQLPVQLEGTAGNLLALRDNQNMTFDVTVLGQQPSLFFRQVMQQQGLFPKPAGVALATLTYLNQPVFGTDANNSLFGGLDRGYFYT